MKKLILRTKFPRLASWWRQIRIFERLLNWTEERCWQARKRLAKLVKAARRKSARLRRSYVPEFEGLEVRYMPTALQVTSLTATATGFVAQFNQAFDPAPLNVYDASSTYGPDDAGGVSSHATDTLTFGGTPTGGTFTLAFQGSTTAAINYSTVAATLQTNIRNALNALGTIGSGNSLVTMASAMSGTVDFQGALDLQPLSAMTGDGSGLQGTGPPVLTVALTRQALLTRGTLLLGSSNTSLTYVKTGTGTAGVLTAGAYRVVFRSASNGFKDGGGNLLDGDANGSAGGDYITTFTVASTPSVILNIPDFARGPDSGHNVRVFNNTGNAVQTITFGGTVTGGTFTLAFNGVTTAAINYSTVASDLKANIQSALDVLSTIGLGNTAVSSSVSAPTVTFQIELGGSTQPTMTATNSLQGTAPTISVSTTTAGVNTAIPITYTGASNVTDVTFDLNYNPSLLDISGTFDSTAGTFTLVSRPSNGVASFSFHSGTPRSGTVTLGQIVAKVPDSTDSSYGAAQLLHLSNIVVNSGGIANVTGNDGVQAVAYFGDADGNKIYTSNDSTVMSQMASGTDNDPVNGVYGGFSAYPLIDSVIVGDINANNAIEAGDTSLMSQFFSGTPQTRIILPRATHLSVTASTYQPTSGSAFSVTVTALDALGHTALYYGGLVHFTTSDAGAVTLPSDYRFVGADLGTHTFISGATLITAGNQTIRATDSGTASITGTSSFINPLTVNNGYVRSADPVQAEMVPIGNAAVLPGTGNVIIVHALDLDRSPTTPTLGGEPALVYNSGATNVYPIVETVFTSDPGKAVPNPLEARLAWNGGGYGSWISFSTSGHAAGDTYSLAIQVGSAVTSTDYYSFSIDVKPTYGVSDHPTYTFSGNAAIVVEGSTDPFGYGWSLAGVDHLVTNATGGAILIDGETGLGRYFSGPDGGGNFTSPANDFGTLIKSGSTYTYSTEHLLTSTFNASGNLTKIKDSNNLERTFVYDGGGLLTLINDPDGSTATLSYSSSKLSKIEAPGSRTVTITVDGSSNLTKVTNPDNGVRTFTYSGAHQLTGDRMAPLGTFSYDYSSVNGTVTTITLDGSAYKLNAANAQALITTTAQNLANIVGVVTDPLTHAYTYTLDTLGRATKLVTPDGGSGVLSSTWSRYANGLVFGDTDPRGNGTFYTYDSVGDPTAIFTPDGSKQQFSYDSTYHQLTVSTDPLGNKTTLQYDAAGNLTGIVDAYNKTTTFLRDASGNATVMVDALGNRTSYLFDSSNRATVVIDALTNRTTSQLDAAGNATVVIDARNNRVTIAYDPMRRVTSVTEPGLITSTNYYDYVGHATQTVDANGNIGSFNYDGQGRLSASTQANGTSIAATTTILYDAAGNATQVTDAGGHATQFQYDTANRASVTIDALSNRTTTFFDKAGNVTGTKDANGNLTQYLLDSMNRVTETIDALSNKSYTYFDAAGNLTGMVDANNRLTAYVYDLDNRLSVTVDALSNRTTLTLDAVGNATVVLDANNHTTSFLFDALNRGTVNIDALSNRATSFYDAVGNMTGMKDVNGNLTQYLYDPANSLTVTIDALNNSTTLLLDANGNVTGVIDPLNHGTSFLFDALDRGTVTIDALGNRTTSFFDAAGNLTGMRDGVGRLTQYFPDAIGQVTMTTDIAGQNSYSYFDAAGNVTGVKDANSHLTQYFPDADNRVTMTTDPSSKTSYTSFDAAGNVTASIDANSHRTSYVVDALNRQTVTVDALADRTTAFYDAVSNMTGVKDANNNLTQYFPDAINRVTMTTNAANKSSYTYYDAASNVTGTRDPNTNLTRLYPDALNRVTMITDPASKTSYRYFDAAGNMTGSRDANNQLTQYLLDADNRVTMTIDPNSNSTRTYYDGASAVTGTMDANHRLTQTPNRAANLQTVNVDPTGARTTTLYDAAGNVTSIIGPATGWGTLSLAASGASPIDKSTFPPYSITAADVNSDGIPDIITGNFVSASHTYSITINISNGSGGVSSSSTISGFVPDYIVALAFPGNATPYLAISDNAYVAVLPPSGAGTYGSAGTATLYALPVGYAFQDLISADFNNDGLPDLAVSIHNGSLSKVYVLLASGTGTFTSPGTSYSIPSDAGSKIAAGDFNGDGYVDLAATAPLSGKVTILPNLGNGLFDAAGLVTITTAANNDPDFIYVNDVNGDGKLDILTADQGNRVGRVYLGNGNLTFSSFANFDPGDVPILLNGIQLVGDGNVYMVTADDGTFGSYIDVTPPVGNGTFGSYQRYTITSSPLAATVADFNGDGVPDVVAASATGRLDILLGSVSGTTSSVATMAYDSNNRVTRETHTLGSGTQITSYAYDSVGLMTSIIDALGRKRTFQYDSLNRLTTETWFNSDGVTTAQILTSMYDAVGNLTAVQNAAGNYTMLYDALNRVTVVQEPYGQRLTFTYDDAGNRSQVEDSKSGVTTSLFDGLNRVTSRKFSDGSHPERVDLAYTDYDMLSTLKHFSDLAATATVATTTYLYDNLQRATSIYDYKANGTVLASFVYNYDAAGRLTSEVAKGTAVTYTYNTADEVKADGSATYTFDGAGNRSNYTVAAGNQVTNDGVYTYTYDIVGNVTKKSKGASAETWTYGYDNRNQVLWIEKRATDGGTLQLRIDEQYDYFGRRIEKAVDSDGNGSVNTKERYAYLDDQVWADLDGLNSNALTTRYLYGDHVDQLFSRVASGTVGWYLTDHLGSVRNVVDNNAAYLATVTYDAWGNTSDTAAASGRMQYAGYQYDKETNTYTVGWRVYDPTTSRWLTQDPIMFSAGDPNLYRYVGNRQTIAIDPSGLDYVKVDWDQKAQDGSALVIWVIEKASTKTTPTRQVGQVRIGTTMDGSTVQIDPGWGGATIKAGLVFALPYVRKYGATLPVALGEYPLNIQWVYMQSAINLAAQGVDVSKSNGDQMQVTYVPGGGADGFAQAANLAAGFADTISVGLTRRLRQAGDFDAVNYNSDFYTYGTYGGQAFNTVLMFTPAGAVGWAAVGMRGIGLVQQAGNLVNAVEAAQNGDLDRLLESAASMASSTRQSANRTYPNCFPAGTLVSTEAGLQPIQEIRASDKVWAFDLIAGEWKPRRVIETYITDHEGGLVAVTVAGEVIEASSGHPFWVVEGEGLAGRPRSEHIVDVPRNAKMPGRWVDAGDLRVGDTLLLKDGRMVPVTELVVREVGQTLYNFRVEELQCYAVGVNRVLVHNNSAAPTTARPLDWSIVSGAGETRAAHIAQHGVNNLRKPMHGVFYGDPAAVTNEAWALAQQQGIRPITHGGVDIYVIPRPNSGWAGGIGGQGQNLNQVTIITRPGTNQVITAYPGNGTPLPRP